MKIIISVLVILLFSHSGASAETLEERIKKLEETIQKQQDVLKDQQKALDDLNGMCSIAMVPKNQIVESTNTRIGWTT